MEALQKLLHQTMLTAEKGGTAVVAQRGNYLHALNISKEKIKSWIVDSGASDHMTGDFTLFSSYSPCPYNYNVQIADGTHSKVMGKGSIIISPNITLDSVLYVPKLDCNLLSISKITRDLKCVTKFFSNLCEFQTLESGKTIGNAEECVGLYLLQVEKPEEKLKNNCHVAAAVSSDNNPGEHIENSEYQLLPLELTEHDKILPNQTGNTQSAEPMPKPAGKLPDQTSNIQPSERTTKVVTETEPIIVSTTSQQDYDPKTGKWKGFCYKRKEVESSKSPMQGHESNQTLENEVPTGSIMYVIATRLDMMYVVCLISHYMANPREEHMQIAIRALRYLRGTLDFGLFYRRRTTSKNLAYIDIDYARDVDDINSTLGYVFLLSEASVCWSSKKQVIITLSSTEAEYVVTTSCACHCVWMKGVLEQIGDENIVNVLLFFVTIIHQSSSLKIL
ncbi:hypothetical protein KIW84_071848 [Lathyrus oleraceus]|uniref:Retrovirus-related Pol polyprotein from transposon TNT 1-94-like beta-barrel domain-containing protein n=1 Tax=Pisum sativum TaxID=3888 RepID=A0A9D4VKK8_PEA|nr:hypothetical protein KIW84_071848 [Pisum sativum]